MATLTEKIYSILTNDETVAGIVSDRIHIGFAAEDSLPYVTFEMEVATNVQGLGARSGKQELNWQFDCYSNSLSEAHTLEAAVRAALDFQDAEATIRVTTWSYFGDFAAAGEKARVHRFLILAVATCDLALA